MIECIIFVYASFKTSTSASPVRWRYFSASPSIWNMEWARRAWRRPAPTVRSWRYLYKNEASICYAIVVRLTNEWSVSNKKGANISYLQLSERLYDAVHFDWVPARVPVLVHPFHDLRRGADPARLHHQLGLHRQAPPAAGAAEGADGAARRSTASATS